MNQTAIEWTDATWNPVTGCTKIGPGCDNCYAERFAERWRGIAEHPYEQGFDLRLWPARLSQPGRWKKPRMIFVNSMSDLFNKKVPRGFIDRVFEAMETADWHVYQVLTKRSSLMRAYVRNRYGAGEVPGHIWLGVSVEDAAHVSRIRHLRNINLPARFISFEPLLGPVGAVDLDGIAWAIVGGESGPGARPMEADWARQIRSACESSGTSFFFKQWGGARPKSGGRVLDGEEWNDFPLHVVPEQILQRVACRPGDWGKRASASGLYPVRIRADVCKKSSERDRVATGGSGRTTDCIEYASARSTQSSNEQFRGKDPKIKAFP